MKQRTEKQQRANRLKLAKFIETRLAPGQLEMGEWVSEIHMPPPEPEEHECGTACCAMGWAAMSCEIEGLSWWAIGAKTPQDAVKIAAYHPFSVTPVVDGEVTCWGEASRNVFGYDAWGSIFTNETVTRNNDPAEVVRLLRSL